MAKDDKRQVIVVQIQVTPDLNTIIRKKITLPPVRLPQKEQNTKGIAVQIILISWSSSSVTHSAGDGQDGDDVGLDLNNS